MNQYTSVGGVTRINDSNGNLSDDGSQLYSYDFQNQLVRVTNKATMVVIADYRYDALGRRVEKAINGGVTTRYILEDAQVVEEYDGGNVWQARYVYEDGIDRPRCMDRADVADVNGNQNTLEVLRFHFHQQALGSVTEMTQPTGAVVEWATYDLYGQPTIRNQNGTVVSQSGIGSPFLFTGRRYDPESRLYFYRARTYDPGTGRFLQRDPMGFVDSLSLYAYVGASPSTHSDPRGLWKGDREGAIKLRDEKIAEAGAQDAETVIKDAEARLAHQDGVLQALNEMAAEIVQGDTEYNPRNRREVQEEYVARAGEILGRDLEIGGESDAKPGGEIYVDDSGTATETAALAEHELAHEEGESAEFEAAFQAWLSASGLRLKMYMQVVGRVIGMYCNNRGDFSDEQRRDPWGLAQDFYNQMEGDLREVFLEVYATQKEKAVVERILTDARSRNEGGR